MDKEETGLKKEEIALSKKVLYDLDFSAIELKVLSNIEDLTYRHNDLAIARFIRLTLE